MRRSLHESAAVSGYAESDADCVLGEDLAGFCPAMALASAIADVVRWIVEPGQRNRRQCVRCALPEGLFHVRVDPAGVCNYCREWDRVCATAEQARRRRSVLEQRLGRFRARFHYDAAVGLSGGKDSAYVLHRLVGEYGANVVAVTFDNGFLTDDAWRNIREVAARAGVDHFVYRPDWTIYREFYRAAVRKLADPCVACSVGGYVLSVRGCRDMRIPFFVHGRSPMQMYRHLYPGTRDPGLALLRVNAAEYSQHAVRRAAKQVAARMRLPLLYLVPDAGKRLRLRRELLGRPTAPGEVEPEFLAFFLFEPYDEVAIVNRLEAADTGYRRPTDHRPLGHGDCLVHDAAAFLYERHHGVPRLTLEVAALVRQGAATVDEARSIVVANQPSEAAVERSVGHLLDRLEMRRPEFEALVDRLGRKRRNVPFG